MRFSEHFQLGMTQYELDFVDVPLETDIPLFIDPYAISIRNDPWFVECNDDIVEFFSLVLESIRSRRPMVGLSLLSQLPEPNQTHLGLSSGRPAGRSIGRGQAAELFQRLGQSRAVTTGFLNDLADCELVIPGIGRDKISDITTNIIKSRLFAYTAAQCSALNLPTTPIPQRFWIPRRRAWANEYVDLPLTTVDGRREPIILVPKVIARLDMAFDAHDYYNKYVLEFLQAEEITAGGSLVKTLKNGRRVVYKKDVEEQNPYSKEFLFEFSLEHEELLERYKRAVEPALAISNEEIEIVHPQPHDPISYHSLCDDLASIAPGNAGAAAYHRKMLGIVEALFYPDLRRFEKEREIDQGRRRPHLKEHRYVWLLRVAQ